MKDVNTKKVLKSLIPDKFNNIWQLNDMKKGAELHFLRNVIAPVVVMRRCLKAHSIITVVVFEFMQKLLMLWKGELITLLNLIIKDQNYIVIDPLLVFNMVWHFKSKYRG